MLNKKRVNLNTICKNSFQEQKKSQPLNIEEHNIPLLVLPELCEDRINVLKGSICFIPHLQIKKNIKQGIQTVSKTQILKDEEKSASPWLQ